MLLVVLLALALRLAGIGFGRPYVYHPDEWVVAKPALDMTRAGDWDPDLYLYPSALVYAERLLVSGVHVLTAAPLDTSASIGVGGLPEYGEQNLQPAQFTYVLVGRILVALLGALTVLFVYLAARRLTGTGGALAAAALLAVASVHVVHSHYLATDVPTGAATALTLWLALESRVRGWRWLVASGLAAGVAASTKYNGGLVLIVPLLVHVAALRHPSTVSWSRFLGLAAAVATAAAVGFVLLTPAILFDTAKVLDAIALQAQVYARGHAGAEGNNIAYYLSFFWPPVVALVAVGLAEALRRRAAGHLAVAAFAVAYSALITLPTVRFSRNLEPMMPFVAILVGVGVGALLERTSGTRVRRAAAAALVLAVIANSATTAVGNDLRLLREDTRSRALDWILTNLTPGSVIVREDFTPQVPAGIYEVGFAGILSNNRIEFYQDIGARYLVASSAEFERFTEPGWERTFYERLLAMPIIYDERPSGRTTGPRIVIIDLQAP